MGSVLDSLLNPGPTQEVIDPETGLPKSQVAENKLQAQLDEPMSLYGTDSNMSAKVDPTGASRTARVDAKTFGDAAIGAEELNRNLVIDDNFQDLAAHQQSWGDKWANGVGKMALKTGTAVVGGIGMIGSSIYALGNGEFSKVYDNAFHNDLDAFDAWLDGRLPNYVSKEEEEMNFFRRSLTANFWAGDLFGNVVPFVAGAILTEVAMTAATAYTVGGAAPAQAASLAGLAAKATSIFSKVSQGVRATSRGGAVLNALGRGTTFGKRLKQASTLGRKLVTGAGYEAGVEARHHINTLKDEFTADFIKENGRAPNDEERADIHDLATQSGNWVFTGNLALVGGGNLLQFPKIFGAGMASSAKTGRTVGTILKEAGAEVGESIAKPYKAAYKSWSKGRNLVDAGYHALKNPIYEGLIEEGGQGWLNNAGHHNASKFWAQKHDPSGVEYGLGMIEALGATFQESYGTKGAWDEIGMGMLVGGLGIPGYVRTGKKSKSGKDARKFQIQGGAIGAMRDRKEKRARTDKLVNKFNENPSILKAMAAGVQNYARTVRLQEEKDGALAENDIFTYKNAENDEFHSYITSRVEVGMYQDVVDSIKEIEELSNDEFVNDFGYSEVAEQEQWSDEMIAARKQKVMQSALTKAAKIKKATDIVDRKFKGVQGWSQEELTKAISQFGHHLSGQSTVQELNALIRDQLIHSASTIENVDIREEELIDKLDELTGGALRTGENASDFQEQMRGATLESNGARVQYIMKILSDSDKLADNDPNKLSEQEMANYMSHLANLQQAIAMGQQENSVDDAAQMAKFAENNPKEFAKTENQEEALGLLRDLRKLRARRQEFLGYYNALFTKEGQKDALTQVEFFMDQNDLAANKLAQEEAAQALQEGNDKKFREATEGIEFKVLGLDPDGNQTEGFYTWAPESPTTLFNVKDSSKKLTIDDLRTFNKDGSGTLNEGVTPLTTLQTEKRKIREAIARIRETDPAKIIATEKALEELNNKVIDLAERLEKLNLTAANKDSKGRMHIPAGTIATKGKQKGKNIGGQLVKNSEVLDVIEETTEKIATVTAQRNKLRLDLELFRENAVMLDAMLKESGEGPMVSPFQRSLEERVALEQAIKAEGLRKIGISGTTLDAEQVDGDGNVVFEAQERRSSRSELINNAENSYYSTAEVLEQVSAMIAQQEANLESLIEKNEVLKEAILDDSFLSLMQEFQKDNLNVDPQDPAAFIAYTNAILANGAESVTRESRKWKGKDRDYWNATAERHAELLAAKPDAMQALYSRYAEIRDAKEQANLMLDEFYATEEKIENLKKTIERDKVREARLSALESRKADGLGKVQRSIVFGTGYKVLQKMLETIGREEAAQEALLATSPVVDQPQVHSSTGDIYMDDVYGETVTNEAGEEVPQESPTEVFKKGAQPGNQKGGAYKKQYKPDATEVGYGKTAGIDQADKITNQDPKHMSPSQRTFYRFIDDIKGAKYDIKNYKLRAVSLNNNPYPELTEDFVTKDKNGKVINNEDSKTASILLVVVGKDGNPIKLEGPSGEMTEFVFTNMLLPDPSGERFSGIEGDTGISQDAWLNITDQYTASRQAVLNSKDGITFNITGFSKGVPNLQTIDGEYVKGSVVGRLVNRVEDVKNIRLQVATEQDKDGFTAIAMGTTSYKAKLGMIYAHHKSRPVPMELRTLNNGEIETVMQILMGHGRAVYSTDEAVSSSARIIPGTDNISVFDRLHDLIKFGEWKNKGKTHSPKYSIHLETKGEEKYIVFAGERILLQSIDPTAQPRTSVTVVEGKAQEVTTPVYNAENAQKLRDFLATKMHNVNLKTLKSTEKYIEVQINSEGEVKEDEYANYGEYLMKPRATMSDTPLTTSLVPMVERGKKGEGVDHTQFRFTYLKYDLGHYAKPAVAPATPKAPVKQASPEGSTDVSNLADQANALSDPSIIAPSGLKSAELVPGKNYNLIISPVGKDPIKILITKDATSESIKAVDSSGFGSETIATIIRQTNKGLQMGIPFEVSIAMIKQNNPAVTAVFSFESVDAPIPAPISAEVKDQGQTVEEAVVEKTDVTLEEAVRVELDKLTEGIEGAYEQLDEAKQLDYTTSEDIDSLLSSIDVMEAEWTEVTGLKYPNRPPAGTPIFKRDGTRGFPNTQPTSEVKSSTQEIVHKNNTYVVDINNFTVTNKKTGKVINTTSPIGVAVMDLVDFDALEEPLYVNTTDSGYEIPELGEEDSPFLLASRINMAEERFANIAKELAWFEERFPNIPISTVPGLIEGVGYGQTIKAGQVILSQLAVEGTVYHEAFHVVEGKFISAENKAAAYAAYTRLTGIKEGVSEEIAEEFRTWMLTDGKFLIGEGSKADQTLLQRFFQAIKDFMNLILGKGSRKDQELLQNLFKSIKNGRFTTPNPQATLASEAKQFKRLKKADGTLLSSVQSVDFIETMVGNMFKVLFSGDVENISMPDLLNLSSAQHSDLLAARVDELMTKSIQGYISNLKKIIGSEGINEASKAEAVNLLETVGSQPNPFWSVLKQGTFEWLQKYKVEINPITDVQDETKKLKDSVSMMAANEVNVKQMAPAIIKLLMATLPAGKSRSGVNSVLGEGIVNSRKFFNLVMQELASTESFKDQMSKLKTLMTTHPEFAKPIQHLGVRLKANNTNYPVESLTPNEFQMQQQFRQQFHKAYSEDFMALVDEETGAIKFIRTNSDRKSALTIEEFRSNLKVLIRNEEGPFKELENGDIYIDMDAKMDFNGKKLTLEQFRKAASSKLSLPFLEYFGIKIENSENLSTAELDMIYQSLHGEGGSGIVSELIKLGIAGVPIEEFFSSESGAFTRLKKIIDIQASRTTKTVDLQHQAADGKTNYSIILNNFASNIIGRLNNGRIPKFLLDRNGNALESVQGSLLLEGASSGLKIGFGAISGFKIENSRHGKVLEAASPRRLFQTEFTSVLTGNIPLLRAAEKKTEFALNLKNADSNGNSIYQMMPKTKNAYAQQMMKYLRMEIFKSKISAGNNISGYRDVKGKLRLFEYLPIDLESIGGVAEIDTYLEENKDELQAAIIAKLNTRTEAVLNAAVKNDVFIDYGKGQYLVKIDPAILKELGISGTNSKGKTVIERAEALKIAERFEMLHSVGSIEQTITILGDVGFYKADSFFKRTSGPVGPKKFASAGARINTWLNEHMKRKDGKTSDGKFNVLTYADVKGSISTDVFMEYAVGTVSPEGLSTLRQFFNLVPEATKDIGVKEFLESILGPSAQTQRDITNINLLLPYLNFDEADAQGYITLDEYMEFMERVGDVTPTMRAAYAKVQAGIKLSKAEAAVFTPLKPQYFGPSSNSEIYSPIFLKLSLLPVYPQLFNATNPDGALASMYEDMVSKQVGITVFESGVKIGSAVDSNGDSNSFYTPTGEYSGIQNGLIQELDYEYFGIQVEMGEVVKDKTTKGSQNRSLLVANAYDSGQALPGKENIARKDAELSALENETNDVNFQLLKDEFGIKENESGDFIIDEDGAAMFAALLRDEGVRREMDDAYLDGIDEFLNSPIKVLDSLGNKSRIENLLFSLVSNRVVRSKIHGGAKVQVASTGFEQGIRTYEDVPAMYQNKHKFGSNVQALGFYRRGLEGNQTVAMQVMLPHYFKELIGGNVEVRKGVIYKDGVAIGTSELLEIYGYRIPTSALNSIEAIEVAGFLPQEAGDAIMVPSEIVVKAGSDYDIDKLTLYFPNYEWSKRDNKLTRVKFLTPENSTIEERVEQLKRLDAKKYSLLADSLGVEGVKEEYMLLANNLRKHKKALRNTASESELKAIKSLEAQKAALSPKDAGMYKIDFMLGILGSEIFKDVESIDEATQELKESIREHEARLLAFDTQIIKKLTEDSAKEEPSISTNRQNAQKAIDNRIIKLSRDIVLDPANFDQLIRPVSADRLKALAGNINKAKGVSTAAPEFSELLEFERVLEMANRFWGGKAGLGMAAVANTHHIKAQKAGLGLFLNSNRNDILNKFNTFDSKVDENDNRFMSLGNTYDVNGENLISEVIGEFINAFVDVSKDPFVFDINANLATFASYIGLIRTGVPIAEAAAFISQQSIKTLADDVQNFPGAKLKALVEKVSKDYLDLALKFEGEIDIANDLTSAYSMNNLMATLKMEPGIKALEEARKSGMSIEDSLAMAGITSQQAKTYYTAQSILVNDFYRFNTQIGSPISALSKAIKSDRSSGTARSRAHARLQIKEQEALWLKGDYINLDKYVGEESYMRSFNDVQEQSSRLFNSVFVSDRLPEGAAIVDKLIQRAVDSTMPFEDKLKYVDLVEHNFVAYILSTVPGNVGEAMHKDAVRLMQGKGKNVLSLPRRIKALQQKLFLTGEKSLILDELFPILETGDNSSLEFKTEGIKRFSKQMATQDRNILIEDMGVLMAEDPQLAEDIVKFAILQSGNMTSPIAFTDLIPADVMARVIGPVLENYLDSNYTIDVKSFEDQFVQNVFMNPIASEQFEVQKVPQNMRADERPALKSGEVRVIVNSKNGPFATRGMPMFNPPSEYVTVHRIDSRLGANGGYTKAEKAELKLKGKKTTLTRVFKLGPDEMSKWVKAQEYRKKYGDAAYYKKMPANLKVVRWNEMPRKGDGMRFTEYSSKNTLSIIGENNRLLDKSNATPDTQNTELKERLVGDAVKIGNIFDMGGIPIIPVAETGEPSGMHLAREAQELGILTRKQRRETVFRATNTFVSARIKEDFKDPTNTRMLMVALGNIESMVSQSPNKQFLMPPLGLRFTDYGTAEELSARVTLLHNLAQKYPNLTIVLPSSSLMYEEAHTATIIDMFNCK